ncbi:MAG: hypothetical protein ACYS5V_06415 [Planctomycetota bacterium]|jgi:hypothetical protein
MTRQEAEKYLQRYELQLATDDAKYHANVPSPQHIQAAVALQTGIANGVFPEEPKKVEKKAKKKGGRRSKASS